MNKTLSSLLLQANNSSLTALVDELRKDDRLDQALGDLVDALANLNRPVSTSEAAAIVAPLKAFAPAISALAAAIRETQPLSQEERERLSREHYPKALAWLERHGVCEPSDVAAPVFIEVLNNYKPTRGNFSTLLFWLLRRRAAGWFRERARRPVCEPFAENFDPPGPPAAPYVDRVELEAELAKGWSQLDRIDQRLFWLHYVADFSFPEIAAQSDFIGCRLHQTAMRTRVSRALKTLRPWLLPFKDVPEHELKDAIHRVARNAETLTVQPVQPSSPVRADRRRDAARSRCVKRRSVTIRE